MFRACYGATHCCYPRALEIKDKAAAYYCSFRFCEERHYLLGVEARSSCSAVRILYTILSYHSVGLVRERTIPTERPPPVGEVSAYFCG